MVKIEITLTENPDGTVETVVRATGINSTRIEEEASMAVKKALEGLHVVTEDTTQFSGRN